MQGLQERIKASVDPIVATVAGIVSVAALIVAIVAMARTAEPDALTRAEAEQLIDQAVARAVDPAAYTQVVVARAMSRYDAEGREASIAYHSSKESIDGPWYVFLLDENGFVLANPARRDFVGTTPAVRSDITGKPYGLEMVAADEDGRWVDYVFVNPTTGEPERKHTWVIKHDGLSFASGWYEPISREDYPATYTQAFVARALSLYNAEGRDATVAHYNTSESVDSAWYVFVLDEEGTFIAHPTRSDLVGESYEVLTDVTGKFYGQEIVAADEDGRWVDYVFTNPATGKQEVKHTWVVRHDGVFIGSGWYEPISREDELTAVVVPEGGLNVRTEPRADAEVAYVAPAGSRLKLTGGNTGEWWAMEDGNWVQGQFLRFG